MAVLRYSSTELCSVLRTTGDMTVLAGNSLETCHVEYGAVSLKSKKLIDSD